MDVNLVLFKSSGIRKSFHLSSTVTVIGRRQDCDLCIPLMIASRRHCELNQDQGQLTIRDLGSRNGTFLNGQKVVEAHVQAGDTIQVGPVTFAVQIDGVPTVDSIKMNSGFLGESQRQMNEQSEFFADIDDPGAQSDHGATEIGDSITEEPQNNHS